MTNQYTIETGIEMPKKRSTEKGKSIYPLADMNVGQSFFVPCVGDKISKKQTSLQVYFSRLARQSFPDRRFATRQVDGGIRVWRVK